MKEKIRNHMNQLFTSAPKTRKAMELKEEMTQNTIEKYQDLLGEGYSEEDAFQNVISSIGDVTELFEDLEEKNLLNLSETDRKKKAILTSVSVGLYIFAAVVFFSSSLFESIFWASPASRIDFNSLGLILAGIICIPPTCMLVYAANMYPDYHKKEENLVETFKANKYTSNRNKAIRFSLSIIIWTLAVCLYFIISFATNAWYVTWVIFLIGACVQAVSELLLSIARDN